MSDTTTPMIDTTGLENISVLEPLINPATALLSIVSITPKNDDSSGKCFYLDFQLRVEEEGLLNQEGGTVPVGKYVRGRVFTLAKDKGDAAKFAQRKQQVARDIKNLILALNDIPVDAQADAKYSALPTEKKDLFPLEKWNGTRLFGKIEVEPEQNGFPAKNNVRRFSAASSKKKS